MEELVKLVSKKTGLSADMSKVAIETVLGFLKKKLPAPIAAQVDAVLKGDAAGVAGTIGSLLGGKKK
ncbi:MAG TPA: hypothetical protein PKH92_07135 [Anaerolineaceae bacterium]|jgi:hypothetical protein|nr:hypothetical protein [Longilinea sp.]HNS37552.1 hypothetical protein [Anaerolineaceae bacterium]HNZ13507.1 hypothetical protein [Anaerolineaceae bacterium]HOD04805.1 hypothetical protein [Anaerolineaceae bacterium]HOG79687.1 hypothetical protein [Anaerolineaceae bacterium]